MRARRIVIALSSLAVVAVGLALTPSAWADSVQYQSYQRASQTEACAAQLGETPWQASWGADSSWSPSWEQWANKGNGGWTCTRSMCVHAMHRVLQVAPVWWVMLVLVAV